jgi:hypothetical protein
VIQINVEFLTNKVRREFVNMSNDKDNSIRVRTKVSTNFSTGISAGSNISTFNSNILNSLRLTSLVAQT